MDLKQKYKDFLNKNYEQFRIEIQYGKENIHFPENTSVFWIIRERIDRDLRILAILEQFFHEEVQEIILEKIWINEKLNWQHILMGTMLSDYMVHLIINNIL